MEGLIIVAICLSSIIIISLTEKNDNITEKNEEQRHRLKNNNLFNVSKKIGEYIYFDNINKKWTIPQGLLTKTINNNMIHSYNDIVDFELIEDGNSISKGGIGRAVVGGALFGKIGAIIGGTTGHKYKQTCTNLQIKITLNNINIPCEYITFINVETKKDSVLYKTAINMAREIISTLQVICKSNTMKDITSQKNNEISANIDEIRKYKNLFDVGAITEEEFEKKKKELLNL